MRVYNSLTRTKEEFVPREPGKVAMYVCGPTVYNHIHLGNARTFLSFDVIRRYLEFAGYDVTFAQNVTDVDDKIINRANEEGRSSAEVAEEYTDAFISAMRKLGVEDPDIRPKATEEIDSMIDLIERLIERGHAYAVDGDVYFAVRSFPQYGELTGRNIDDLRSGARVDVDERKRDPLDFALWKAAKPGEPSWPSPWGEGRPGWHTECSAMSERYLGLPFDIHGGGSDLSFPHHENEVAQSVAATGKPFVKYWMHGGMLRIDDEKMSKSLGNFLLIKDVLDEWSSDVVRLLMLQTHYRSPLDFSDTRLLEAQGALERLRNAVGNARWLAGRPLADDEVTHEDASANAVGSLDRATEAARAAFIEEMDDDFNTAGALGALFTLTTTLNATVDRFAQGAPSELCRTISNAADTIGELLGVLGISLATDEAGEWPAEVVDLAARIVAYGGDDPAEAVEALLEGRAAARTDKDWATADAIRNGLAALGFTIEDTAGGARVSYEGVE